MSISDILQRWTSTFPKTPNNSAQVMDWAQACAHEAKENADEPSINVERLSQNFTRDGAGPNDQRGRAVRQSVVQSASQGLPGADAQRCHLPEVQRQARARRSRRHG